MLTKDQAKEYWYEKQEQARKTMRLHECNSAVLIECASKVLVNGLYPDLEFSARLDRSIELYHKLSSNDTKVHIYVPGSLHRELVSDYSDSSKIITSPIYVADKCTLSTAGRQYLIERGVLNSDILGDQENVLYKGDEGVLNSADECFVASKLFHNGSIINGKHYDYRELHCVCSPIQVTRKWFYYLEFGIVPLIHSVPFAGSDVMDIVTEQLRGTENVIYNDHNAQSHDSEIWINSQKERKGNE